MTVGPRARLAALAALAGAWLVGTARAEAPADKPFTIANYPVEARAKDAVTAKEQALADGQQAAFRSLLKRIVPVTAYNRTERLKAVMAADLIDGVAVRSERNSSTDYIASLDFSFQAEAVRDLLKREGVPFIDREAPPVVLVPVIREGGPGLPEGVPIGVPGEFRAAGGTWDAVWKGLDLENSVTPVRIEALLAAVHPDTLRMLLAGTSGAERILKGEYKSDHVLVAVAEVDRPAKRVHVALAGWDAAGPLLWQRSYRLSGGDIGYTMELAAVVTLGVLEGRWKAAQSEDWGGVDALAGPGTEIALEIEFSSLAEWNEIRRQLLDIPGVDDVRIGAVSARNAEVSLRYPGGGPTLANALVSRGLSLRNDGDTWLLRPSF